MQTRSRAKQLVSHAKFERTVNLLLMIVAGRLDKRPTINVDGNPSEYAYLVNNVDIVNPKKIVVHTRGDGTLSRPDAEMQL